MEQSVFPDFVRNLPQAKLSFKGLSGWILQSNSGQVLFNESEVEVLVPEHRHGSQWGVVINGKIELMMDGKTRIYSRGDTYYIPAGTNHSARIHPGFRAIDYFADKDRYSTL